MIASLGILDSGLHFDDKSMNVCDMFNVKWDIGSRGLLRQFLELHMPCHM